MSNLIQSRNNLPRELDQKQIEILKTTVFKGLNNDEVQFAVQVCNRTGFDPFLKQIHFIKRVNNKTKQSEIAIQVSIDGFRLTAQRAGGYAGSEDPVFDNENEPKKATVTIHRIVQGLKCSFTASARWNEFVPAPPNDFMWKKMPCVMLGKCAEAQALRKAFPAELSGMYAPEELENESRLAINSKAADINKEINPPDPDVANEVQQNEILNEVPFCQRCGMEMQLTKSKQGYYCPNWEDKKNGDHSMFKVGDLEAYLQEQTESENLGPTAYDLAKQTYGESTAGAMANRNKK